jgi:alkylation response protein AidB-like acyl-CoA dehydrogenase
VIGAPWRPEYAGTKLAGGVKPEEFDAFHEMILLEEVSRAGSGGVVWGLFAGLSIGLPPILHFGSPEQQKKVCGPCLMGEKGKSLVENTVYDCVLSSLSSFGVRCPSISDLPCHH